MRACDPESPTDDVRDTRAPENYTVAYLTLGATTVGAIGVSLAIWFELCRRAAGAQR